MFILFILIQYILYNKKSGAISIMTEMTAQSVAMRSIDHLSFHPLLHLPPPISPPEDKQETMEKWGGVSGSGEQAELLTSWSFPGLQWISNGEQGNWGG